LSQDVEVRLCGFFSGAKAIFTGDRNFFRTEARLWTKETLNLEANSLNMEGILNLRIGE
jgi:hypothetical protein